MKSRTRTILGLGLAGTLTASVFVLELVPDSGVATPEAQAATEYLETFDTADSVGTLDFYVTNGRNFDDRPTSWNGDHAAGAPCGGPTTSRVIHWPDPPGDETPTRTTDPGEVAYWCAPGGTGTGHLMTSFKTGGYAHIDFAPKQTFSDVRRVCWDQNVTNLGNRKWTQVAIAPKATADAVAPRLDWTHPGFRDNGGPASWGLPLDGGVFLFSTIQGNAETFTDGMQSGLGYDNDTTVADKAKRVVTCLVDRQNGQVEVRQQRADGSMDISLLPGRFPTGEVKVVFQDVTYNPDKALQENPPLVPDFYTWHWDNLVVSSNPGAVTPLPPTVEPSIAGEFDSLSPARLVDSRNNGATVDGEMGSFGPVANRSVTTVQVTGRGGVRAGARAATLNVTSVGAAGPGYLVLFPCGEATPVSSHVNYFGGDVVANLVFARLNSAGQVCVYAERSTNFVIDVTGAFPSTSHFAPITPARYLDTRASEQTFDGNGLGAGLLRAGSVSASLVAGRGAVPAGATAVVVNLTAVNPRGNGYVTAYPCGADIPEASNLNYFAGQTVANSAVIRVGAGGQICFFTLAATDLIVDVQGSFASDAALTSFTPVRLLDSRPGQPTGDGQQSGIGRRPAGSVTEVQIEGRANIPAGAGAVSLSVIVEGASGDGYATVYPCGQDLPTSSNVNYGANDVSTNAVVSRIGAGGKVCIYTLRDANLIVDASGWFPE